MDFKQEWGDKALHTVAAFANTFGGLLILGVSESDGRPVDPIGIPEEGELKTRLASLIASNLAPVPDFSIATCRLPQDQTRCLAIIRVRQCPEVCLITKKGESSPAYVRVEDISEPAKAPQLRALIERARRTADSDTPRTATRIGEFNKLYVFKRRTQGGGSETSQSFFRVVLLPTDHPRIEIDLNVERRFTDAVLRNFPGHENLVRTGTASVEWESSTDWSQFTLKLNPQDYDYERRWRVTFSGDIGFVTQSVLAIDSVPYWSLYDVAADLSYILNAASEFWQSFGYYGRALLSVDLRVLEIGARLLSSGQGYAALFYDLAGAAFSLDSAAFRQRKQQDQGRAEYQAALSHASMAMGRAYTVSCVLNNLLRSFGFASDLHKLEQSIRTSFTGE